MVPLGAARVAVSRRRDETVQRIDGHIRPTVSSHWLRSSYRDRDRDRKGHMIEIFLDQDEFCAT
ncbi:hypothetical protein OUZ56_021367 [Daphnia magna]|uniref:Uncharacterized protein n=1 Tax=Daphnia magna TaxID=35525 RepID=A0ABQ9ZH75_9CRUS|nr:hypothetical protein OUZ56_021367 [Daphnia magna]